MICSFSDLKLLLFLSFDISFNVNSEGRVYKLDSRVKSCHLPTPALSDCASLNLYVPFSGQSGRSFNSHYSKACEDEMQ